MARRSALDWGVKGPRAMSVGLGGWEYNLVIPRRKAWITIHINNNPFPIGPPRLFVDLHWPPSNFDSRWGFSIQRRSPFAVHQGAPS